MLRMLAAARAAAAAWEHELKRLFEDCICWMRRRLAAEAAAASSAMCKLALYKASTEFDLFKAVWEAAAS